MPAWKKLITSGSDASLTSLTVTNGVTGSNIYSTQHVEAAVNLKSLFSSGDEGGEIFLNKPVTNTSISTGVNIDIYQNKLRIWESGGTNRGGYYDITALGASVGTNLAGGAGTVTSVATSGTVSGITLTGGPITSTGTITLGGSISGLTNSNLSGTAGITNANLANSSITIGSTAVSLGSSATTIAGLTSVTSTGFTGALTGNASTATQTTATVSGTNSADLVYGNMADNDQFRIRIGGTGTNSGFVEIATADDGTEPIHVRQYTGVFSTITRTATLLDGSGNTSFPGTVTATGIITVNPTPTITITTPAVCSTDLLTWSVGVTVSGGTVTSTVGNVLNTSGNIWTISGIPIATTNITITSTELGCLGTLSVTAPNCSCLPITAPIAANASYCSGTPISPLTVTNGPAAGFTLNWYDAATGGTLVGTGTPFTPLAAGTYYAQFVETATSCTSQRTAVIVSVNALPIVTASGTATICGGATATLNASNAVTYSWSPSATLSAATGTTVIASPTSTQTYTVTGTDANGCVNTADVTITVTPTPNTSPIFHD
jgi:hypothetical protein